MKKNLAPYNAYIEDKKIKELKYIHKNGYRIKHIIFNLWCNRMLFESFKFMVKIT